MKRMGNPMENPMSHFKPEQVFMPTSPEGKELSGHKEIEFVTSAETGKIEIIGSPRDVRDWIEAKKKEDPTFEISTEEGGVALPGLTDSHHHPVLYGTLNMVDPNYVYGIESPVELLRAIREGVKDGNENIPKLFVGHSTVTIPDFGRKELDEASAERPVCLYDTSFHGLRCNTEMLKMVNEYAKKESAAGRVISGEINERTGQLTEGYSILALEIAESFYTVEEIQESIEKELDSMLSHGITDLHEMETITWNGLVALLMARKDWVKDKGTEFPVRKFFVSPENMKTLLERQKELESAGLFDPQVDWKALGVKLIADGSIGSHTAQMNNPYDDIGGVGTEFHSSGELNKAMDMVLKNGIENVAMHAIGDKGIQRALDFAKKMLRLAESQELDTNFRLEHFELPTREAISQTASIGAWVSSEPGFICDYNYEDRLTGRKSLICPHADIINGGVKMMAGSDGMPTSALFGIFAATHHPNKEQRISFEQALSAYSLMGAEYERNHGRGRIAQGGSADIIVIDPETLKKLLPGYGSEKRFANYGNKNEVRDAYADKLDSGIKKIIRAGQIVKDNMK